MQRALARPTLQELFLALLRAATVELEALYTGARPTTLFFLAEALLEYEQQFGLWRFHHVQLVERVLGPLTGGTGGTLGAKYLARTIDQKFFPALWSVRATFYGTPPRGVIHDISVIVRPGTPEWPGDVPFSCGWTSRLATARR